MDQQRDQNRNQYQNQPLPRNILQRSVSPNVKLIVLKNLDQYNNQQKSIRARDNTSLLDVILYLENCYQNHCTITLYHKNKQIFEDKNTYLIPFLQNLKTQQLEYRVQDNSLQETQSEIPIDDDQSPNLGQKLLDKDISSWRQLQNERKDKKSKEIVNQYNYFQNQQQQQEKAYQKIEEKSTTFDLSDQQNMNSSSITFRNIDCTCGKSYNSAQLRSIVQEAILKKQIALCQFCQKSIPKSMYIKLNFTYQEYHNLKLTIELQSIKNNIKQTKELWNCKNNCGFFCFLDKNKPHKQVFCPICLDSWLIAK